MKPRYIEICGGIASGKTTLAFLTERIGSGPLFENFQENPFWKAFYTNPGKYIFETEITFALMHYHQIQKAKKDCQENSLLVCDFSFALDLAYAKIGLNGSKLAAFECVAEEIRKEIGLPDLLIHLECHAAAELTRIRGRAREEESLISLHFLDTLNQALSNEVARMRGQCPILTINSAKNDFANDEAVKAETLRLIQEQIDNLK